MTSFNRQEALTHGQIRTFAEEPTFFDISTRLIDAVARNSPPDFLPDVLRGLEHCSFCAVNAEMLNTQPWPIEIGPLTFSWRNWPVYQTGPVCGFVEFEMLISMQEGKLSRVLFEVGEGLNKN
jgi:hypothetical protein